MPQTACVTDATGAAKQRLAPDASVASTAPCHQKSDASKGSMPIESHAGMTKMARPETIASAIEQGNKSLTSAGAAAAVSLLKLRSRDTFEDDQDFTAHVPSYLSSHAVRSDRLTTEKAAISPSNIDVEVAKQAVKARCSSFTQQVAMLRCHVTGTESGRRLVSLPTANHFDQDSCTASTSTLAEMTGISTASSPTPWPSAFVSPRCNDSVPSATGIDLTDSDHSPEASTNIMKATSNAHTRKAPANPVKPTSQTSTVRITRSTPLPTLTPKCTSPYPSPVTVMASKVKNSFDV